MVVSYYSYISYAKVNTKKKVLCLTNGPPTPPIPYFLAPVKLTAGDERDFVDWTRALQLWRLARNSWVVPMSSPRSLKEEGRWVSVGRRRKLRGWMIKRTQGTKEAFRSRTEQGRRFVLKITEAMRSS